MIKKHPSSQFEGLIIVDSKVGFMSVPKQGSMTRIPVRQVWFQWRNEDGSFSTDFINEEFPGKILRAHSYHGEKSAGERLEQIKRISKKTLLRDPIRIRTCPNTADLLRNHNKAKEDFIRIKLT